MSPDVEKRIKNVHIRSEGRPRSLRPLMYDEGFVPAYLPRRFCELPGMCVGPETVRPAAEYSRPEFMMPYLGTTALWVRSVELSFDTSTPSGRCMVWCEPWLQIKCWRYLTKKLPVPARGFKPGQFFEKDWWEPKRNTPNYATLERHLRITIDHQSKEEKILDVAEALLVFNSDEARHEYRHGFLRWLEIARADQ